MILVLHKYEVSCIQIQKMFFLYDVIVLLFMIIVFILTRLCLFTFTLAIHYFLINNFGILAELSLIFQFLVL